LIKVTDVHPGPLWEDLFYPGVIDNENGTITSIQSQATTSYPDMNHSACTINFTSNTSGMSRIHITYANVTNASFLSIPIYLEEAFVSIEPNSPPELHNVYPENGETGVDIGANLSWTCNDPDGDIVTYDVYFGTTSPPPQMTWNQSETTYNPPGDMDYETLYYWYIIAWDEHGLHNTSDEWHFITEQAEPDLDCSGTLSWTDVEPGSTVEGSFTVENNGEPGSELDWEITEWPDWGSGSSWTFTPSSQDNLTPEDGPVTVEVEVVAPDEEEQEFTGEIKIINNENPNDYCIIPALLITPVNQHSSQSQLRQLLQRIIERFPHGFQIPNSVLQLLT
jgi:hypothetical protein